MKKVTAKTHLSTSRGFVRRGTDISWMSAEEIQRFRTRDMVEEGGAIVETAVPLEDLKTGAWVEGLEPVDLGVDGGSLEGGVLGLDAEDSVVEAEPSTNKGRKKKGA